MTFASQRSEQNWKMKDHDAVRSPRMLLSDKHEDIWAHGSFPSDLLRSLTLGQHPINSSLNYIGSFWVVNKTTKVFSPHMGWNIQRDVQLSHDTVGWLVFLVALPPAKIVGASYCLTPGHLIAFQLTASLSSTSVPTWQSCGWPSCLTGPEPRGSSFLPLCVISGLIFMAKWGISWWAELHQLQGLAHFP